MALLEEVSPSPKVIRSPLSSEKGVRLVRAREKGVELGENTSVGTRRDRKVFQTSSLTQFHNQMERRNKAAAGLAPAPLLKTSSLAVPKATLASLKLRVVLNDGNTKQPSKYEI